MMRQLSRRDNSKIINLPLWWGGRGVCVCQDAHVWLFDRWKQHLFVHSSTDEGLTKKKGTLCLSSSLTYAHTCTRTHSNLLSQGSPWAAQIGFGWLRSQRLQISQALHLFESLNSTHSPNCLSKHHAFSLLFSFFSPSSLFLFSLHSPLFSLFLTNSPLLAHPIYQNCISFSFSLHPCLLSPFTHSLTHSSLPLALLMNGVESSPAVSPNAAAVAFLYSFIQKAVKYSSAFQLLFSLCCLCECITSALLIVAVNELVWLGWHAGTWESAFI